MRPGSFLSRAAALLLLLVWCVVALLVFVAVPVARQHRAYDASIANPPVYPPKTPGVAAIARKSDAALKPPAPFRMKALGAYKEITDRPLFAANRRPPAPPPKDLVSKQRPSLDGLALFGVVIGPKGGVALVRVPKSARPRDVFEGQTVAGWRLDKVLPDRILLSADDETAEITFPKQNRAKTRRPGRPIMRPARPPTPHPRRR